MKSLTKKVLSLVMAIAMVGSFAAFAATTVVDEVTNDGTTVTVDYTATGVSGQLTVIAYAVEDENDATAPADDTIVYINQYTVDGNAPAITFDMRDSYVGEDGKIAEGYYKVIIGGTGVGEATPGYLVVTAEQSIILGDADGNGLVEPADAAEVIAHYLKAKELTGALFTAADADKNGAIEPADAAEIIACYLKAKELK